MTDNEKTELTKTDLVELEAALEEMTDTERHIFARLLELHPIEEVVEIMAAMSEADRPAGCRFPDPDPYAKCLSAALEQRCSNYQIDNGGRIRVKNISAYWIPELTITEIVAGTIYTVTGSYGEAGSFLQKLERITAKNFAQKLEDSE